MKKYSAIILFCFFLFLTSCTTSSTTSISFIDVNQGDSSLISHNNINILIDTGKNEESHNLISYLEEKNIKTIDYLILSHDHEDHSGGFLKVLDNFKIENVILPDILKHETFQQIKDSFPKENIIYIKHPTTLKFSENFSINFLSSFKSTPSEFNDSSLVFKVSINDFDILYTGDIEENGQLALLNKDIESEVIKMPHHGAYNNDLNNLEKFLDLVNPKISVISVGNNSYGHPHEKTLNILEKLNSKILRTDELSNIELNITKENELKISNSF